MTVRQLAFLDTPPPPTHTPEPTNQRTTQSTLVRLTEAKVQSLTDQLVETLSERRGEWVAGPGGVPTLATFQPSYYLRIREHDPEAAEQARLVVIDDFRTGVQRAKEL